MMKINLEMLRGSIARSGAGVLFLLLTLLMVAGCAPGGKVIAEPVDDVDSVQAGPSVTRFQDGRSGFIIQESTSLDEDSRKDFKLAVAALERQDFDKAIELLTRIVKLSPQVTAPHINLAMAYRQIENSDLAEEQLVIALNLLHGHPVASNEYGLLLRNAGRFDEARDVYELALTKFPEYLPVMKNLGILCDLYLNDGERALAQYKAYSAAEPENEQVKLWIAELSLRLGR